MQSYFAPSAANLASAPEGAQSTPNMFFLPDAAGAEKIRNLRGDGRYLADLLNSYDAERWARADGRPLVKEVLARRLQTWAEATTSEGERLLVEELQRDPASLAVCRRTGSGDPGCPYIVVSSGPLTRYVASLTIESAFSDKLLARKLAAVKVLAGYPHDVGRRALGEEYDHLSALNLGLDGLPVRETGLPDEVDQIRVHLNTLAQTLPPSEALPAMLQQASGHLLAEFEMIQRLLKTRWTPSTLLWR